MYIISIGYILHIGTLRPQRQSGLCKVAEQSGGVRALFLYFLITYSASHALLGTKVTTMREAEMVLTEDRVR